MSELFLKIVNMSISASWLVLAVLLLRLVLKKAPKWVSVLLWGFVAFRLICPFSIESMLSLIPSAETISPEIMMDRTPEISTGIGSVDTVINPIITQTFTPQPLASANPLQILIPVAGILWLAGIAAMLLYTAISYLLLCRRVITAVLLRNNIYQSENVDSPFVLGIIKPKIYLPFQMDGKNLEHVIAHEESHIHRKDHWWKPFGFVLLALHWFNPLMWVGYILLCRDIELACDEKVIKEMDNENRADYTQALVACSVNRRSIAACPLAFGEVGVKERVKSVMNYKKPAFWIIIAAIVTCVAVAVCFLTNPKEENDPNLTEDGYYLLIGAEGVESIEVSGPNTSGGVVNADESSLKKGEKVWLEHLQGVTDLRGYSITAYGKNGKIIYALSIPEGASNDEVINTVSGGGWLLTPADFETNLSRVRGKTYVYENEGFVGSLSRFTITLYDDGSYTYNEGSASSYFGVGSWKQDGDIITLTDDSGYELTNHFKIDGDTLVFVEQNSSNFIYIKVKAGEKFHCTGETFKQINVFETLLYHGGDQKLTLNDVVKLSEKGYELGWSDFEKYKYYETGSGLYIRVYPINDKFEVWIGGSAMPDQDDTPMYIYLRPSPINDMDQKIDIRDGGVAEFIYEHYVSTTPEDGEDGYANGFIVGEDVFIIESNLLENAITNAILSQNAPNRFQEKDSGLVSVEAHQVLGIQSGTPLAGESEYVTKVIVYLQYVYHKYEHLDGELHRVAATATPAVLTFRGGPAIGYELQEFQQPNGGNVYASEVRSMFSQDVADILLDPKSNAIDMEKLESDCLEKAKRIS